MPYRVNKRAGKIEKGENIMMNYTLGNALDSCYAGIPAVVAIEKVDNDYNVLDTEYYNGDTIPLRIEDYPVEYIDLLEQYDGKKVICFIAYEHIRGKR